MHAAARHRTELAATAPATRYPLYVALRTFLPGLTFEDTRGTVMYVAGSGVDRGVIRLELSVSVAERLSLVGRLLRF